MFGVQIEGAYGDPDGSVHLLDDGVELVMWDAAEWIEDPSLVFVIANAIKVGYVQGADAVRRPIQGGQASG